MTFDTEIGFNSHESVLVRMAGKNNFDSQQRRPLKGNNLLDAVNDFTAIDIETTGLSPDYDDIIELGAVRYRDGVEVGRYECLVNPGYEIGGFITALTGITNEMLKDAKDIASELPGFMQFLGDDILVGHNVHFDINFLYDNCENVGISVPTNNYVDVMRIGRRLHKEWPNHRLETIVAMLGIYDANTHRAAADAKAAAECYLTMTADLGFAEAMLPASRRGGGKNKLKAADITANEGFVDEDNPLFGKVCVFTGTLDTFTRQEAMQLVVDIGGICEDRVTKRTNFLILGNNDYCKTIKDGKSNKQKRAEELILQGADLQIIPESVFLDILVSDSIPESETAEAPDLQVSKPESGPTPERLSYSLIEPALFKVLDDCYVDHKELVYEDRASGYGSVTLGSANSVIFRLKLRGQKKYVAIPTKHYIPDSTVFAGLGTYTIPSEQGFVRIPLADVQDIKKHVSILGGVLRAEINAYPAEYGCCSLYEQCSDARRCINEDKSIALNCYYHKNLRAGKIFYGKNKNI